MKNFIREIVDRLNEDRVNTPAGRVRLSYYKKHRMVLHHKDVHFTPRGGLDVYHYNRFGEIYEKVMYASYGTESI